MPEQSKTPKAKAALLYIDIPSITVAIGDPQHQMKNVMLLMIWIIQLCMNSHHDGCIQLPLLWLIIVVNSVHVTYTTPCTR